ncbi:HMG-box, partial [Armillaria gallica]
PGHIRRPRNSWILFRSDCVVELHRRLEGTGKRYDSQRFNKVLGKHWNSLSKAQQEPYKALALEAAENHKRLYPDWKYRPSWEK